MSETKLRAALIEARDWFESQAKAVSKGCGSSYELHDLRVQRDALDAALAAPAQAEAPAQAAPEDLSVAYFMGLHAAKRAPQPPAQAQEARQPLTDAEVSSVYFEVLGTVRIQDPTLINRLVRAIEAAHGIK